jgi:hypothetical protein
MRHSPSVFSATLALLLAAATAAAAPRSPREVLGFEPGADGELLDYEQLITYLKEVDAASDRVELREVGNSPEGRPMFALFISAPANIARLDALKAINRRLALEPSIPDTERAALVRDGRVFVMATLSMHSTEVAPSQALPLVAYDLATTTDPAVLERLANVVLMIVPNHNPDGMDMVVKYYRSTKGTPYEGTMVPGVYHRYVGHDNNRDFVALTQDDTRVINRLFSTEWYPQVLVEKHQMGAVGPRYFVPPNHDPIAENVDPALWSWLAVFGTALSRDMGRDGLTGVVSHWSFDNYWPGSTETSLWKGVVSLLTEAASARVATPVWVEPSELTGRGKGLAEYKMGVNMPSPWPGGWWRLGDIVAYELSSMRSLLATASLHRQDLLTLRNALCRKAVSDGRTVPPYFYVFPRRQRDPGALAALVRLLDEHGVQVSELTASVTVGDRRFETGDVVISLAQPYRAFVKEVLELQRYPERRYTPGGELIKPYDITSWSLPAHWGVSMVTVSTASELGQSLRPVHELTPAPHPAAGAYGLAFSADAEDSYRAAFAALERGMTVARLSRRSTEAGVELPAGTFVVRGKPGDLAAVGALTFAPPLALAQAPAVPTTALRKVRLGLVETWFQHADAGWTRMLLDRYHVPYTVLRPGDFAGADLSRFDVLVFPSADRGVLVKGRYKEETEYRTVDFPPQYKKGLGKKGLEKLVGFVERGGTVVAWGESVGLFTDELKVKRDGEDDEEQVRLPVRDITEARSKLGLFVPGAWLRMTVRDGHPLTWGLPAEAGGFARATPVLETTLPRLDADRRVLAVYPERDLLVSGYLEHEEQLASTPAVVWVRKGKGQLALFSFAPQARGSTPATFKLLWNGILLPPES